MRRLAPLLTVALLGCPTAGQDDDPDGGTPPPRDATADGSVADAATQDADAPPLDLAVADVAAPDGPLSDVPLPDGPTLDFASADLARPDGLPADGALPDLALPDGPPLDGPAQDVPLLDAFVEPDGAEPQPDAGGPPPPIQCGDIADQTLLDLVYDDGPKVPPGFYNDAPEAGAGPQWRDPCSNDLATTRQRAADLFAQGVLTGDERSTAWFHEVDVRLNGGHVIHLRNTRCDYYDGQTLAGAPHEDSESLRFLAGYLWYTEFHNLHGAHIGGGNGAIGDAANFYVLCHMQFVGGDFGLCDEITLRERSFRIGIFDGMVSQLGDEAVRQIQGRCN